MDRSITSIPPSAFTWTRFVFVQKNRCAYAKYIHRPWMRSARALRGMGRWHSRQRRWDQAWALPSSSPRLLPARHRWLNELGVGMPCCVMHALYRQALGFGWAVEVTVIDAIVNQWKNPHIADVSESTSLGCDLAHVTRRACWSNQTRPMVTWWIMAELWRFLSC